MKEKMENVTQFDVGAGAELGKNLAQLGLGYGYFLTLDMEDFFCVNLNFFLAFGVGLASAMVCWLVLTEMFPSVHYQYYCGI